MGRYILMHISKEEIINDNLEAIFNYTVINKNYDKDPDTVEYIKEAEWKEVKMSDYIIGK